MPKLVYSSGPDGSGGTPERSDARVPEVRPPARHDVRVRRETGGRRGKTVTVVAPLFLTRDDADGLSRALKKLCGGGGTVLAAEAPGGAPCFAIEVQGDHVARVAADLAARGFRVRAV